MRQRASDSTKTEVALERRSGHDEQREPVSIAPSGLRRRQ